jgi:hypothetical protein
MKHKGNQATVLTTHMRTLDYYTGLSLLRDFWMPGCNHKRAKVLGEL